MVSVPTEFLWGVESRADHGDALAHGVAAFWRNSVWWTNNAEES
jgi:hypothetical protein